MCKSNAFVFYFILQEKNKYTKISVQKNCPLKSNTLINFCITKKKSEYCERSSKRVKNGGGGQKTDCENDGGGVGGKNKEGIYRRAPKTLPKKLTAQNGAGRRERVKRTKSLFILLY